jgi:hypothetical protein
VSGYGKNPAKSALAIDHSFVHRALNVLLAVTLILEFCAAFTIFALASPVATQIGDTNGTHISDAGKPYSIGDQLVNFLVWILIGGESGSFDGDASSFLRRSHLLWFEWTVKLFYSWPFYRSPASLNAPPTSPVHSPINSRGNARSLRGVASSPASRKGSAVPSAINTAVNAINTSSKPPAALAIHT